MLNVLISDINFEHEKTNSSKKLVYDLINCRITDDTTRIFLIATHKINVRKEKNVKKIFVPFYKNSFQILRLLAEVYFNLYCIIWLIFKVCVGKKIALAVISPSILAFMPLSIAKLIGIKNRYLIQRDLYYNNFNFKHYISLKYMIYLFSVMLFNLSIINASKVGFENSADRKVADKLFRKHNYKFEVLFNWYKREHPNRLWEHYIEGRRLRFIYAGNLGVAQNPFQIIDVLESVFSDPGLYSCDLYGNGSLLQPMLERLSNSAANIQYKGILSSKKLATILDNYDFGLISLDSSKELHNVPGKLMYYLDSSLPVVCIMNEDCYMSELVESSRIGLFINENSSKCRFTDFLTAERDQFGMNIDKFFENLNPDLIPARIWRC